MAQGFFDQIAYPWHRPEAIALHKALYTALPRPKQIDLLYRRCASDLPPLNLTSGPDEIWQEALNNLTAARKLEAFCRMAREQPFFASIAPMIEAVLTPSVDAAIEPSAASGSLPEPRRPASTGLIDRAQFKKEEIEEYLRKIGSLLPTAKPDAGLLPLLDSILTADTGSSRQLRAAFGFPSNPQMAAALYSLVSSRGHSSLRPLGEAAQRINECLWRFEFTLEYVKADWAADFDARSKALRTILAPHLIAKQPSLYEVLRAIKVSNLSDFAESAPDPSVYAVLRSFKHSHTDVLDPAVQDSESSSALDFLFARLQEAGFDDSANAWWAMRTGICRGDQRFLALFPQFLKTFRVPAVPPHEVVKKAYLPEIYTRLRTISYTLSNAQAIVACQANLPGRCEDEIRGLIKDIAEQLVIEPISENVYLVAVHHEGLRNYLDFVAGPPPSSVPRDTDRPKSRDEPSQPPPKEPDAVADHTTQLFQLLKTLGIAGGTLGVFYLLYIAFIDKGLNAGQTNLALSLIFGVAAIGCIIWAARVKNHRWLPLLLAAFSLAILWLGLGMPGLATTEATYNIRVTVENPGGAPVDDAHVWSSLGGEVKAVSGGAEIEIPRSMVNGKRKLKVYAEVAKSSWRGDSGELDLGNERDKSISIRLKLQGDVMVRGIVVDSSGNSIANASVMVVGYSKESVQTDSYGGFELNSHVVDGEHVNLRAEKAPYGVADNPFYKVGGSAAKLVLGKAARGASESVSSPLKVEQSGDAVIDRVMANLAQLKQMPRPAPEGQWAAALAPLFERPAFYEGIREEDWKYFLYTLVRTRLLLEEYQSRFVSNPESREKFGGVNRKMNALANEIATLYGPAFSLADYMARYVGSRNAFVDHLPPLMQQPTAESFAAWDQQIRSIRDLVRSAGLPVNPSRH